MSKRIHKMTQATYEEYRESGSGLCDACGAVRDGFTEPDAENYPCDSCGQSEVQGIENLMIESRIKFTDERGGVMSTNTKPKQALWGIYPDGRVGRGTSAGIEWLDVEVAENRINACEGIADPSVVPELVETAKAVARDCACTIKERMSGHRTGCEAPRFWELIARAEGRS